MDSLGVGGGGKENTGGKKWKKKRFLDNLLRSDAQRVQEGFQVQSRTDKCIQRPPQEERVV